MKIRSRRFLPLVGLLALVFSGCAQTVLQKTWSAPSTGELKFTKLFVVAMSQDDTNRRLAEVGLKTQITKVPVVAAYEYFPDVTDTKDKAKVIQAVKESQADGIVVMRMAYKDYSVTQGASNAHAMEYAAFSDYYGTVYDVGAYYSSDTRVVHVDSIFYIETRIFDAKTGKLVWAGETKSTKGLTTDHDVRGLIIEVAQAVKSELRSQKLLR